MHSQVETGLEVLLAAGFATLRGERVGVLAHPASLTRDLQHIVELCLGTGLDLRILMGPEHGMQGGAQDMQPVAGAQHPRRGIPILSLYGQDPASLRPPPDVLSDIDVLVVDLQDVGCRCYTYAVTLRYCMEECARAGVRVVVCDRPNPLNGNQTEGPLLQEGFHSFVGGFPVPVRHGLTLGEMAGLAREEGVDVELEVVAMRGWSRSMWFDQTGLPWVLPSPNMPTLDTATVYPGASLLEATNLSEGRGTTRPFELAGAPWLDARRLAGELASRGLAGVRFRPAGFIPAFQKHAGVECQGVQLHVEDRSVFEPFLCGLVFLDVARRLGADHFAWRDQPYEFVHDRPAIDLLAGGPEVREALEAGGDLRDLQQNWQQDLLEFAERRQGVLLYSREGDA